MWLEFSIVQEMKIFKGSEPIANISLCVIVRFCSDCPLHRVQADCEGAADQGELAGAAQVHGEGLRGDQEEHPAPQADARVHERDQGQLRAHQLGDGRVRQPGVGWQRGLRPHHLARVQTGPQGCQAL